MEPQNRESRLAAFYAVFRTSRSFFIGLLVFVASWMTAHWLFNFDSGLGGYNSILSTEASLALGLMAMEADKHSRKLNKMLEYQIHVIEALQATVKQIGADVADRRSD